MPYTIWRGAIDEEVCRIIRRIFDENATGRFGVRALAHRLNVEGHPIVLDDVLTAWRQADAQGRRELLVTQFEELDVHDGRIVGYRPRFDHEVEVAQLIGRLFRADNRCTRLFNGGPGGSPAVGCTTAEGAVRLSSETAPVTPLDVESDSYVFS